MSRASFEYIFSLILNKLVLQNGEPMQLPRGREFAQAFVGLFKVRRRYHPSPVPRLCAVGLALMAPSRRDHVRSIVYAIMRLARLAQV